MKILSLYPYTHISSAALMINGELKYAAPEERFNRIKMSTSFPLKSMKWCLDMAKLKLEDIDLIAIPWNPAHNINTAWTIATPSARIRVKWPSSAVIAPCPWRAWRRPATGQIF